MTIHVMSFDLSAFQPLKRNILKYPKMLHFKLSKLLQTKRLQITILHPKMPVLQVTEIQIYELINNIYQFKLFIS